MCVSEGVEHDLPVDGALVTTLVKENDLQRADEDASAKPCIAVIVKRHVLAGLPPPQHAIDVPLDGRVVFDGVRSCPQTAWPNLVILSLVQGNQASVSALKPLLELVPTVPVIVLASVDDVDLARTVLRLGAKGYIPVTKGFEIAIEAVRFVLDGALGLKPTGGFRSQPAGEARHNKAVYLPREPPDRQFQRQVSDDRIAEYLALQSGDHLTSD